MVLSTCLQDDDPESAGTDFEGTRLEGLILRSQLLVLLQRRAFCDESGHPIGRDVNPRLVQTQHTIVCYFTISNILMQSVKQT